MARILLTHTPRMRANYYGDDAVAGLRALGEVRCHEGEAPLDAGALIAAAEGCHVIVADRMTEGPAAVFEALPELCAFVRVAVDIRNIDVAAASAHGVLVTQASAGFVPAVAELVLGFLVDLTRGITDAATAYHNGKTPTPRMGRQLAGGTLGIIGYGAIGSQVAAMARALDMRVLLSDPHVRANDPGIEQTTLEALLRLADYVVCLALATAETENLMDAAAFAAMPRHAYFINASRGNLVDEAALEAALREGRIAGAAMDVGRAPDQMPSARLAALPNVIATPHIGGLTPESISHQALETVRQAAEIVAGRAPVGAVNADAAARLERLAQSS